MYGCGIHSAEYHTIQSSCRPTSHHQISARDRDDWYDDGHREVGGEDRDFTLAQQDDGFVHHSRECGEATKEARSKQEMHVTGNRGFRGQSRDYTSQQACNDVNDERR